MLVKPLLSFASFVVCLVMAGVNSPSQAQDRPDRQDRQAQTEVRRPAPPPRPRPPAFQLDDRHRHDHYYPSRGHVVRVLPHGSLSIGFRDRDFFFHGGVWFQPFSGRYVVVAPPIGIVVPFLPQAHVTLWIGGVPLYYANGAYYRAAPAGGYVVVQPPDGVDTAQSVPPVLPPKAPPEPIFYPRGGQSTDQTEVDRRECNRWATTQAGAMTDALVFQRAVAACMEGRGYTVR